MSDLFRIALGQMTVAETGTENLAKAVSLMRRAACRREASGAP